MQAQPPAGVLAKEPPSGAATTVRAVDPGSGVTELIRYVSPDSLRRGQTFIGSIEANGNSERQ